MIKDTSMIRVSTQLRDSLKTYAQLEGRELTWVADRAIELYLNTMTTQKQPVMHIKGDEITYSKPEW